VRHDACGGPFGMASWRHLAEGDCKGAECPQDCNGANLRTITTLVNSAQTHVDNIFNRKCAASIVLISEISEEHMLIALIAISLACIIAFCLTFVTWSSTLGRAARQRPRLDALVPLASGAQYTRRLLVLALSRNSDD
jgi:hypothetical protein